VQRRHDPICHSALRDCPKLERPAELVVQTALEYRRRINHQGVDLKQTWYISTVRRENTRSRKVVVTFHHCVRPQCADELSNVRVAQQSKRFGQIMVMDTEIIDKVALGPYNGLPGAARVMRDNVQFVAECRKTTRYLDCMR
jgi:hypothetical protein